MVNSFAMKNLASEHAYKVILTTLHKPDGGEYGKFYSLPALNDPRIGRLTQEAFVVTSTLFVMSCFSPEFITFIS